MASATDSTPAPVAHGPVTAAIRAVALGHDPSHSNVIPIELHPNRRPPTFAPLGFNFPLTDTLWSSVYLSPVRFAVRFTDMRGREAVEYVARARITDERVIRAALGQLALAVDHFEELAELCRTARARLIDADAFAARQEGGRARQ